MSNQIYPMTLILSISISLLNNDDDNVDGTGDIHHHYNVSGLLGWSVFRKLNSQFKLYVDDYVADTSDIFDDAFLYNHYDVKHRK